MIATPLPLLPLMMSPETTLLLVPAPVITTPAPVFCTMVSPVSASDPFTTKLAEPRSGVTPIQLFDAPPSISTPSPLFPPL